MIKFSNIHTHTVYCDGKNTPEEMIERAEQLGFVSLGFSGHASQNLNHFYGLRDEQAYIAKIRELQAKNDRIRIHLGVELDQCAHCDREKYDYVMMGLHYFIRDGLVYPLDGLRSRIQAGIDNLFYGNSTDAAKAYFRNVAEQCERLKPDVMAHYDVIAKNNEDGTLFDIEDPAYQKASIEPLEVFKAQGVLLEVNTGAMARGYRTTPYPYPCVMKRWQEMGGKVILGSDCHNRDFLNHGFDMAVEYIRAMGFKTITRLGGFGEERFVEDKI